jgi:ABC-2 type transport system permease protein
VRGVFGVAWALAYRQTTILIKNPSLFVPPMLFPLLNFTAFAGGLSRLRHVPGFDYHGGYTAFQFVFVLLQSAAFAGVFTGFSIARDFERGFARRLLVAAPQRGGIILGMASRRSCAGRWSRSCSPRSRSPSGCAWAAAGSTCSGCTHSR